MEVRPQRKDQTIGVESPLVSIFWRPHYAKMWWIGSALMFAILMLFEGFLPGWGRRLLENFAFLFIMAFHPFTIIFVLACCAAWRSRDLFAFRWGGDKTDPDFEFDDLYSKDSIGLHRRCNLADPSDIRSPLNPANSSYRGRR